MCNDLCLRGRVCPGGSGYNYLQGRSSIAKAEQYGKAWCNVGRGRRWRCDRRELGPAECGDIHSNYSSSRQDPVVVVVVVVVAGENGDAEVQLVHVCGCPAMCRCQRERHAVTIRLARKEHGPLGRTATTG